MMRTIIAGRSAVPFRRCYRVGVVPVADVLPGVLAEILTRAPLSPEKVAFAWRHAAGPAVDRATQVELRDSVLRVQVRDAVWKREVERAAPVLKDRLRRVLGDRVLRRIEVTIATT